MRRWVALLAIPALAGSLAGCDREVRTVVHRVPPPEVTQAPLPAPTAAAPASAPSVPSVPSVPTEPPTRELGAAASAPGFQGQPGDAEGARLLAARALMVPVQGIAPEALMDTYEQARGGRVHEAMDILAPTGTPVVAVDDGRIAKLFTSKPGGLTIYQFDRDGKLAYYYAHLDRYAPSLAEGQVVKRGTVLGYVGSTGNADAKAPHLHFAIFKLGPQKNWWQGEPINPYPALRQGVPARVTTG